MRSALRRTTAEIDAEINADVQRTTVDIDRAMAQLDEWREAMRVVANVQFENALERLRMVRATAAMRRTHAHPPVATNVVPTPGRRAAA